MKRDLAGFTLLELMLAIAIVGILSSIATTSYSTYQKKNRVNDGMADVYRVMSQQERFYMNNLTYTEQLGNTGLGYALTSGNLYSPAGYFRITAGKCRNQDNTLQGDVSRCVRITATGVDDMNNYIYWLQSDGFKSSNLDL